MITNTYEKPATRADIKHLANWLYKRRKQSYDPGSCDCLLTKYLESTTGKRILVGMYDILIDNNIFILPSEIKKIAYNNCEYRDLNRNDNFNNAYQRAIEVLISIKG